MKRIIFYCHILLLLPWWGASQQASVAALDSLQPFVVVKNITIEGKHRTKDYVVLRELEFGVGDTLFREDLQATLLRNENRLMNTGLFNKATIFIAKSDAANQSEVIIAFEESWKIYPIPLVELADRNFNVWWNDQKRSLSRINFGINLLHINTLGHNDPLRLTLQTGYAIKYELVYRRPWFNKKRNIGLEFGALYVKSKEVNVATAENNQVFYFNPDAVQVRRRRFSATLDFRPKLLIVHRLGLEYHHNNVSDTIGKHLNRDFFGDGRLMQRHFSLRYSLEYDKRDIKFYPLNGWYIRTELRKNGLYKTDDLRNFRLSADVRNYTSLSKKWCIESVFKGRATLPRSKQPFFNNQAIGYFEDYVRGYELYVVDGLDYGIWKTSLHFGLYDGTLKLGKLMPLKGFRNIPTKVFLSANNDLGYANDPYYGVGNPLSNSMLHGYGVGLDFVFLYTSVIQLEYSWNRLGDSGVYLHFRSSLQL